MVNVDVHYITRVEGHGNIHLKADNGKVDKVMWEVIESPRFFEAMMRGLSFENVPYLASRICGICSIAHTTASIQAVEAAFGIKLTPQAWQLRKLLFNAEVLESHVLHTLFLAAPDFLGAPSVLPMVGTHKDVVLLAVRMKKLAYQLAEILAGRKTHPLYPIVGGFSKLPDIEDLKNIRPRLEEALKAMDTVVGVFKTLKIPDFTRETEYIALKDPKEYAFISGQIGSSDTATLPLDKYLEVTNEFCMPHSTAKFTKHKRDSYMVGALSRFNLNSSQLLPKAKKAAAELGLKAPNHNPYMITVAQVVETVHALEDSLNIIDALARTGIKDEVVKIKPKAGRGVGAVEAPRGILFHDYTFDDNGILTKANCIIPTNQNHFNIQKDMEKLAPEILNKSEAEIKLLLEMLVRAYDPCISCSTH